MPVQGPMPSPPAQPPLHSAPTPFLLPPAQVPPMPPATATAAAPAPTATAATTTTATALFTLAKLAGSAGTATTATGTGMATATATAPDPLDEGAATQSASPSGCPYPAPPAFLAQGLGLLAPPPRGALPTSASMPLPAPLMPYFSSAPTLGGLMPFASDALANPFPSAGFAPLHAPSSVLASLAAAAAAAGVGASAPLPAAWSLGAGIISESPRSVDALSAAWSASRVPWLAGFGPLSATTVLNASSALLDAHARAAASAASAATSATSAKPSASTTTTTTTTTTSTSTSTASSSRSSFSLPPLSSGSGASTPTTASPTASAGSHGQTRKRDAAAAAAAAAQAAEDDAASPTASASKRAKTKSADSGNKRLDGEKRLCMTFEVLGDLGKHPQFLGSPVTCKDASSVVFVPDGMRATFKAYGQQWVVETHHLTDEEDDDDRVRLAPGGGTAPAAPGEGDAEPRDEEDSASDDASGLGGRSRLAANEDGVRRVRYVITNAASGLRHEVVETVECSLRRAYGGRTVCNRAVKSAIVKRIAQIDEAVASTADFNARVQLAKERDALANPRISEGPLFYGLRHATLQNHLRALAAQQGWTLRARAGGV